MASRRKLDPVQKWILMNSRRIGGRGRARQPRIATRWPRLRVPLYLKDGAINPNLTATQRGKAAQQTEDAVARSFGLSDGLALHRPGFRRVTDAAALERTVRPIWTTTPPTLRPTNRPATTKNTRAATQPAPALAHRVVGIWRARQLSVLCRRRGLCLHHQRRSGHLGAGGQLAGPTDARSQDAASIKADAYADYDREMADAWRTSK